MFYQCEDGGYWDLQENIHIFGHPTLEILTIQRAKLDQRGFDSLEQPSETALKELHLIECDINDDALSELLLLPEALKEITITQLEVPSPPLEESPDDMEDYIFALHSAQHSLETVLIDFPTLGGKNALRMRDFGELKSLQLRDYQLFGRTSGSPRLHSVGLPPQLEILEFLSPFGEDEEVTELLCYTIERKDILARKWSQMIVVEGEGGLPAKIIEACTKTERQFLRVVVGCAINDEPDEYQDVPSPTDEPAYSTSESRHERSRSSNLSRALSPEPRTRRCVSLSMQSNREGPFQAP